MAVAVAVATARGSKHPEHAGNHRGMDLVTAVRMPRTRGLLTMLLSLSACQPGLVDRDEVAGGDHSTARTELSGAALAAAIESETAIRAPAGFRRIGARWSGPGAADFEISTSVDGLTWSRWQRFDTHHSELEAEAVYSGDLWSASEASERYYRLRRGAGDPPTRLALEFFAQPIGDDVETGDMLMPLVASPGTAMLRYGAAEVLPRSAWNARPPRCSSGHTPRRITLHHTEQPNVTELSAPALIRSVQGYHQNTRGWCDIGYHFLISRDGQIWQGRPIDRLGAHAGHGNNTGNVGIALIGNFVSEAPTSAQQNAVAALVRGIALEHGIPLDRDHFFGHREMRSTECPGDVAFGMLEDLLAMAAGDLGDLPTPPRPDSVRLVGAIYRDGDMSDRLATAVVTVNGEPVAVDAFGVYETRVPANTAVTIEVSAPGFEPARIERQAVTDPTWASIGIAETGSAGGSAGFQGVIYTNGDPLDRIGHAVVEIDRLAEGLREIEGGRTAVATSSGYWRIGNLAPGTYTITASAVGFTTESIAVVAESGTFTWASVELDEGPGPESPTGPSCARICGSDEPLFDERRCYCDSLCVKNNDCCDSYYDECR